MEIYVEQIKVRGLVQGVGFRPFVWHLAQKLDLRGWVFNDVTGVTIQLYGPKAQVECFAERLCREAPPLAEISAVERLPQKPNTGHSHKPQDFRILASPLSAQSESGISIPPDISICSACTAEVLTPGLRRYRYPFTNCTHCGPRLSIIRKLPYDRMHTVMTAFPMCEACTAEYSDPADRRYHAQPIACPKCGPRAWLCDSTGRKRKNYDACNDVCGEAAQLLRNGKILAIKGLGGFQLACDARNFDTVSELRRRKQRPHKPFALMLPDLNSVMHYCELNDASAQALQSPSGPIVLLPLKNKTQQSTNGQTDEQVAGSIAADIASNIAPNLNEIGVMLPTTPLHLLLLHDLQNLCGKPVPLVMTSGNLSGEPQCTSNTESIKRLCHIADYWLLHNREIVCRVDDSVLRSKTIEMGQDSLQMLLRRARGYAPRDLSLSSLSLPNLALDNQHILAFGAQEKGAFAFTHGKQILLSQYFGDLGNPANWRDFQQNLEHYRQLYRVQPRILACDNHPEYISAKYARNSAAENALELQEVQHHHAHIAACMAEHGLNGPVLGVAFDGLGYGYDKWTHGAQANVLWGGEFFIADYRTARRVASFEPLRLHPRAANEPWHCLLSHLLSVLPPHELGAYCKYFPERLDLAALTNVQTLYPYSSSVGRLFDAVAAFLLPKRQVSYSSQAAVELEAAAQRYLLQHPKLLQDASLASQQEVWQEPSYPFALKLNQALGGFDSPEGLYFLDSRPMWRSLLSEYEAAGPTSRDCCAFRFHLSLAHAVHRVSLVLAKRVWAKEYMNGAKPTVVLTGGAFQNMLLLTLCRQLLISEGFPVYSPQDYPANDGGLALGQIAVALARAKHE